MLESRFLYEKISRNQEFISPINLYILSDGGSVIAGLSAMDTILACKCPVNTIIDGHCSSAATFMSIVGKRRYMRKNSVVLVHQLSNTNSDGKYFEAKDDIKNFDLFMKISKEAYKKYTKIPSKKLNEIMKHDLYWTAETCLKYGLIDEIL
jgi:ATP-dependent protease ClpP protease subunit